MPSNDYQGLEKKYNMPAQSRPEIEWLAKYFV